MHNDLDRLENDLYWISLMIEFTEKALAVRQELKVLETKTVPLLMYEAFKDSLSLAIANIGEQLDPRKLSMEIREQNPDIPWSKIKKFRDKRNHWYQKIERDYAESIAEGYLPELYDRLLEIRHDIETTLSEM